MGLSNFGTGHYKEYKCEIISNLGQWLKRRWHLKIFLFCSVEQNSLCNFDRGLYEEHFCEIILN